MQNVNNLSSTDLILSLLKANLCHNKLLHGLEKAGLQGEDFYGDLEMVVLHLMGFDLQNRENELYDFYYEEMNKLLEIEVKEFRPNLNRLAAELYEALKNKE
jgi:hypothetical protein